MQITHVLIRGEIIISQYDEDTHTLTRVIHSKIKQIALKDKTAIADLIRLSKLDDDTFSDLAFIQQSRANRAQRRAQND